MWRLTETFTRSKLPRSCEDFNILDSPNLKKVKVRFEKFDQSVDMAWDGQNVCVFHFVAAKLDVHQLRCVLPNVKDVNQKSSKNWNALHFAVHYNNTAEVIQELCKKGVDADLCANEYKYIPLMLEINKQNCNFEVLKILWEYSDPNSRKRSIDLARAIPKPKIVRLLEKQRKVEESDIFERLDKFIQHQEGTHNSVHQHDEKLGAHDQTLGNHDEQLKQLSLVKTNHEDRLSEIERVLSPVPLRRAGSARSSYHRMEPMDTEYFGNETEICSEFNYAEASILRTKYDVVCRQMKPDVMISMLYADGIVTTKIKQSFSTWDTDHQKNMEILDHIMKGPKKLYDGFIRVLQQTNQQHIVDIIKRQNELPPYTLDADTTELKYP